MKGAWRLTVTNTEHSHDMAIDHHQKTMVESVSLSLRDLMAPYPHEPKHLLDHYINLHGYFFDEIESSRTYFDHTRPTPISLVHPRWFYKGPPFVVFWKKTFNPSITFDKMLELSVSKEEEFPKGSEQLETTMYAQ